MLAECVPPVARSPVMDDLKTRFMMALVMGENRGPLRSAAEYAESIERTAIALVERATPAPQPIEPLTERDGRVLDVLRRYTPAGSSGLRASQWKAACVQESVCGRAAWEASSTRLVSAGEVQHVGTRYTVANKSAV